MSVLRGILRRLLGWLSGAQKDHDFTDEIQHHLALETQHNRELGMKTTDAARKAKLDFGNIEVTREDERDARGFRWIEDFLGDVKYALRSLRRSPVLAGAAILTLA